MLNGGESPRNTVVVPGVEKYNKFAKKTGKPKLKVTRGVLKPLLLSSGRLGHFPPEKWILPNPGVLLFKTRYHVPVHTLSHVPRVALTICLLHVFVYVTEE